MISKILSDPNYVPGAYDRCLSCKYLDIGCDGPRTSAMSLERWSMFMQALKKKRGFTNEKISELSGVSLSTVERIMKGKTSKDIMWSTVCEIERVLFLSDGEWPCALASNEQGVEAVMELTRKDEEISRINQILDSIHSSYKEELDALRAEYQERIQHLFKEVDHLMQENAKKSDIISKLLK